MSAELGRSTTGSKGGRVGGESVEGCVGEEVLESGEELLESSGGVDVDGGGVGTGKSCR